MTSQLPLLLEHSGGLFHICVSSNNCRDLVSYMHQTYEYDGQKYHDVTYWGEFEDDEGSHNDLELLDYRLRHFKK